MSRGQAVLVGGGVLLLVSGLGALLVAASYLRGAVSFAGGARA